MIILALAILANLYSFNYWAHNANKVATCATIEHQFYTLIKSLFSFPVFWRNSLGEMCVSSKEQIELESLYSSFDYHCNDCYQESNNNNNNNNNLNNNEKTIAVKSSSRRQSDEFGTCKLLRLDTLFSIVLNIAFSG